MRVEGACALVTGGAGFIGSHLVGRLLAMGAREVRVIDDLSTGRAENLARLPKRRVSLHRLDVRDEGARRLYEGVDAVVHLAADISVAGSLEDPWRTLDANVRGTLAVLGASCEAGADAVAFASSAAVYGDATPPLSEATPTRPVSPYGISKLAGEGLVRMFARERGLAALSLRLFNVYGPRQREEGPYAAVVPAFISAGLGGRPLPVHGDGGQTRELLYVADACEALVAALQTAEGHRGEAYNIAPGAPVSVLELARAVDAALPSPVGVAHGPPRPGDVRASEADPSAALRDLGFRARTPLAEGLRATLEHFRKGLYT